ncbi:MAG TPA: hypothetical protein VES40_09625 [Ilumatobacteraceae bacterium]|nr:hypothetical protein [Ilumatobacteraceae bacterium]
MAIEDRTRSDVAVSSGDPCPFLRALVSDGYLVDHTVPIPHLHRVVVEAAGTPIAGLGLTMIALTGNGLQPGLLVRNARHGVELDELRGVPADKRGSGSRILDQRGQVDWAELDRLSEFASPKTAADGSTELGLSMSELNKMMSANFERARGRRRPIDRLMMMGEWPILLLAMGKRTSSAKRYLAVDEVRTLFAQRRLPARVLDRLRSVSRTGSSTGSS